MNNWFACNNKYPCAEVVRTSCGYGTQYFWFQHTCRHISVLYSNWFWLELLIFCYSAIIIYCILEYLWGVNFLFSIYFRLLMCKIIDLDSIFLFWQSLPAIEPRVLPLLEVAEQVMTFGCQLWNRGRQVSDRHNQSIKCQNW